MNYNLINNIQNMDLIIYRFVILNLFHHKFVNKKLLGDILQRDFYLIFLCMLYNKWNTNI